jgi:hypothetical protein
MQSWRYEENCKAVSERKQAQRTLYTQYDTIPYIAFPDTEPKEVIFLMIFAELNLDMQSWRYEENCKAV